jgi:hypothetical protein
MTPLRRPRDLEANGIFFFNGLGEMVRFETRDRYYSWPDGGFKKVRFTTLLDAWQDQAGVKSLVRVRAVWDLQGRVRVLAGHYPGDPVRCPGVGL